MEMHETLKEATEKISESTKEEEWMEMHEILKEVTDNNGVDQKKRSGWRCTRH